jgi:hypothetical protein
MTMKRKFNKEEKLQIIKEASEQGVKVTLAEVWCLCGLLLFVEEQT